MALEIKDRFKSFNAILASVTLTLLAIGLIIQIAMVAGVVPEVSTEVAKHFVSLAWVALVMLAVDVMVLFWLVVRLVINRSRRLHMSADPTVFVDAWAVAGQRIQVEDEQDENTSGDDDDEDKGVDFYTDDDDEEDSNGDGDGDKDSDDEDRSPPGDS